MQTETKINPPTKPSEWSLFQIQEVLKRTLPDNYLSTLKEKGNSSYIPWYKVNEILDKYCPGWTWEIKETLLSSDRIFIVGRLTIPTIEGNIYREATGTEELKRIQENRETGEFKAKELAYGDPSSNAESMAFRRCAARFGLGLYLYDKSKKRTSDY